MFMMVSATRSDMEKKVHFNHGVGGGLAHADKTPTR